MTKVRNPSPSIPSPFPSSSSTPSLKYRIAIKEPEEWKIQAIAQYKRKQRLKQLIEEQIKLKQEEKNQVVKKSLSKSQGSKMNQVAKDESNLPKEEDIRNAYESHVRELANCHFTGAVAKARIAALHSVRGSLLWLLKKASLHERALIQDYLQPLNQNNT